MSRFFSDRALAEWRRAHGEPDLPLPPKPRKSPQREESRHQRGVISWWHMKHHEFGVPEMLLFAIPNGLWLGARAGRFAKLEGLRAGVVDLMLAVPRSGYHGFFLEMKQPSGKASDAQNLFMGLAMEQGYRAAVAYSYDEAVKVIGDYLKS